MRRTCLLGCLVVLAPASADGATLFPSEFENAVFQCSLLDGTTVGDAGTLERDAGVEWFQENYREFTFYSLTGILEAKGSASIWSVTRQGTVMNDLLAHIEGDDPFYNVMRISTWANPMLLSMTDGMDLYSGTCVRRDGG
jgi:hypothetical protein